jgi:site-specific DNA recombinase
MSRSSPTSQPQIRCAIYTRKSTEEGLQQEFNSLDAQRESAEAYIASQKHEGWECLPQRYDDGGFTGGNLERPGLQRLLADIEAGQVDCVVVYKVDRLSRSLLDFSRIMATFDQQGVSFVSVTQQFNTTSSMGRLTLNILLSFAQFEREIISERTRDKMAAARRKGKWCGGQPILGYNVVAGKLQVNEPEADQVRTLFALYQQQESLQSVLREVQDRGWTTKRWSTRSGKPRGGVPFTKSSLNYLLKNVVYIGQVQYGEQSYPGEQEGIVDPQVFAAVQRTLARQAQGGTASGQRGEALLTSLLRCQACGTAMVHGTTTRQRRTYRYYVCSRAQKQGYETCPAPSVPAPEIEQFVVNEIRELGRDPELLAHTVEQVRRQGQLRQREQAQHRARLQGDLELASEQLRQAALDRAQAPRLATLHTEIQRLQRQIQEAEQSQVSGNLEAEQIERALLEFDGLWRALRIAEQQRLLRLLIQRVEFHGAAGEIAITFTSAGQRLTQEAST